MAEFRDWILPIIGILTFLVLLASKSTEEWRNIRKFTKSMVKWFAKLFAAFCCIAWFFVWGINGEPISRWDVLWLVIITVELTFAASLFLLGTVAEQLKERIDALEAKLEALSQDKTNA